MSIIAPHNLLFGFVSFVNSISSRLSDFLLHLEDAMIFMLSPHHGAWPSMTLKYYFGWRLSKMVNKYNVFIKYILISRRAAIHENRFGNWASWQLFSQTGFPLLREVFSRYNHHDCFVHFMIIRIFMIIAMTLALFIEFLKISAFWALVSAF